MEDIVGAGRKVGMADDEWILEAGGIRKDLANRDALPKNAGAYKRLGQAGGKVTFPASTSF